MHVFFMSGLSESREMQRLRQKLSVELLWVFVLSLLKEAPLHAYVLRKKISERFGFLPGNVSAYVVLYKLDTRGFVSAKKDGNRIVYSITKKGKDLLELAKKEFCNLDKMVFGG